MAKKPMQKPISRNHCTLRLPILQDEYQKGTSSNTKFYQKKKAIVGGIFSHI
jgi:hypothetical protein